MEKGVRTIRKSKFKHVTQVTVEGVLKWQGKIYQTHKYFDKEREAAKWVDIMLIKHGRKPVNVLKPKTA